MTKSTEATLRKLIGCDPPWIVGILNVTPDSFSDGGKYLESDVAIEQAFALKAAGAHIIEIGGESTRPGSKPIGSAEELRRIESVVSVIAKELIVSVDTYRATTAARCIELGAYMINDVSALRADENMGKILAKNEAFIVLMHSKDSGAHASASTRDYDNVVNEVVNFLNDRVKVAVDVGITKERIILDPGMGRFVSHDNRYSWELLGRFEELGKAFPDMPLMISTSRKGFLGGELSERDILSQLTSLIAYNKGAKLIRTHNPSLLKSYLGELPI